MCVCVCHIYTKEYYLATAKDKSYDTHNMNKSDDINTELKKEVRKTILYIFPSTQNAKHAKSICQKTKGQTTPFWRERKL